MERILHVNDDRIPKQKLEKLRKEANEYAQIIQGTYGKQILLGDEGILVYTVCPYESVHGEAYLYLNNRWAYFDSLSPNESWSIRTSPEGIFEFLKLAYLCEIHQEKGNWDVPAKHFRNWMARTKRLMEKSAPE